MAEGEDSPLKRLMKQIQDGTAESSGQFVSRETGKEIEPASSFSENSENSETKEAYDGYEMCRCGCKSWIKWFGTILFLFFIMIMWMLYSSSQSSSRSSSKSSSRSRS